MGREIKYNHILKYRVVCKLASPLHIGAAMGEKSEVLVHPVDGLPFIQASSIAGALRAYCESVYDEVVTNKLFGSNSEGDDSRLVFSDGVFTGSMHYEMRPRVKINSATGTVDAADILGENAKSGQKFDMECVSSGAKFVLYVYVKAFDDSDADVMMHLFAALHNGDIILGGQRSNGFGKVCIEKFLLKKFNLNDEKDRQAWLKEEELKDEDYESCEGTLSNQQRKDGTYQICFQGKIESGLLVKGYQRDAFGADAPDAANIQDANGNYIVPGSSIKGSLRGQIERIMYYRGYQGNELEQRTADIFGESVANGTVGNIRVFDSLIQINKAPIVQRIHIDKLTGGVMDGSLFSEQRVYGDIEIHIEVTNRNNPEESCGYILLALRDLAANLFNLGGEYSIGNGMIEGQAMTIDHNGKQASIDFMSGEIIDASGIISDCLKATLEG